MELLLPCAKLLIFGGGGEGVGAYCQISNVRHQIPKINDSRLILQLTLHKLLKAGVKSRK